MFDLSEYHALSYDQIKIDLGLDTYALPDMLKLYAYAATQVSPLSSPFL